MRFQENDVDDEEQETPAEVKPEDKLEKQGGGQRFRRDGFVLP